MAKLIKVSTDLAPPPSGHYSPGVVHNGLVYVSGQLPRVPGKPADFALPSIEEQTRQALSNAEAVLQAALAGGDAAAEKTLDHFMTFLARASGDVGMALQARGGVYLAGGIAPSIAAKLQLLKYRAVFEEKGRIAEVMKPIPWFVITDRFPAFKGCAAALAAMETA